MEHVLPLEMGTNGHVSIHAGLFNGQTGVWNLKVPPPPAGPHTWRQWAGFPALPLAGTAFPPWKIQGRKRWYGFEGHM